MSVCPLDPHMRLSTYLSLSTSRTIHGRFTTSIATAIVVAYLKIQRATTIAVVVVSKSPRTTTTALKRSQTHTLLTHIIRQNSKN